MRKTRTDIKFHSLFIVIVKEAHTRTHARTSKKKVVAHAWLWEREQPTNAVISNFNGGLLLIHALVTRRVKFWPNTCVRRVCQSTPHRLFTNLIIT